jgi:hypothetical protein
MSKGKNIRAGGAMVELSADDDKAKTVFARMQARAQALGQSLSALGSRMAAVGASVVAAVTPMVFQFKDGGDAMNKMAARTGVTTEALTELGFAAEQSGSDLATVELGLKGMARYMNEAASGSKRANAGLARLGLSIEQLKNLTPDQQLEAIAQSFAGITSPADRAVTAMQIFGRAGAKLIPLLQDGRRGIQGLRGEARDLGLSMSTQSAQAAADLQDAWNRLVRVAKTLTSAIGSALAEELTVVANAMAHGIKYVVRWIRENKAAVGWVLKGAAAVGVMGSSLMVLTRLGPMLRPLLSVLGVLVQGPVGWARWAAVAAAILAVRNNLFGLGDAFRAVAKMAQPLFDWMGKQWAWLSGTASTAWGMIVSQVSRGDLQGAMATAMETVGLLWAEASVEGKVWWQNLTDFVRYNTGDLIKWLSSTWDGFVGILSALWSDFTLSFSGALSSLGSFWSSFLSSLGAGWNDIIQSIMGSNLPGIIGDIGADIVAFFQGDFDRLWLILSDFKYGLIETFASAWNAVHKLMVRGFSFLKGEFDALMAYLSGGSVEAARAAAQRMGDVMAAQVDASAAGGAAIREAMRQFERGQVLSDPRRLERERRAEELRDRLQGENAQRRQAFEAKAVEEKLLADLAADSRAIEAEARRKRMAGFAGLEGAAATMEQVQTTGSFSGSALRLAGQTGNLAQRQLDKLDEIKDVLEDIARNGREGLAFS